MSAIPWADHDELARWVEAHVDACPPLALERLLAYENFEEDGTMPTKGDVRCVIWAHRRRREHPRFCDFRFLVYHSDVVTQGRLESALRMIAAARRLAGALGPTAGSRRAS